MPCCLATQSLVSQFSLEETAGFAWLTSHHTQGMTVVIKLNTVLLGYVFTEKKITGCA